MAVHNFDPNKDGRNQSQPGVRKAGNPMLANPALGKNPDGRKVASKKVKKIFA